MPDGSEIDRRNRALMAFTLLTGARDSAIASMKLKHVNVVEGYVFQDAREVRTKFSKTFTTYFFPVGEDIRAILIEWVRYLREEKLWGNDDPLFPATRIVCGQTRQFEAAGLERAHWSTATPIRNVFRDAFRAVALPYFNPHSIRNTLLGIGQRICKNNEEFKAWSQNLGHKHMVTTMMNYGTVREDRQGELIRGLSEIQQSKQSGADEIAEAVLRKLRNTDKGAMIL